MLTYLTSHLPPLITTVHLLPFLIHLPMLVVSTHVPLTQPCPILTHQQCQASRTYLPLIHPWPGLLLLLILLPTCRVETFIPTLIIMYLLSFPMGELQDFILLPPQSTGSFPGLVSFGTYQYQAFDS